MDFGFARSVEMQGLTQTGAVLGTPAYMSPEQAKGIQVDARSDIFSLGVMFYEQLTGVAPFKADTVWASLLKRTQETPTAPSAVDTNSPQPLRDIVMKCLAIDRDQRYSKRCCPGCGPGCLDRRRTSRKHRDRSGAYGPAARQGTGRRQGWIPMEMGVGSGPDSACSRLRMDAAQPIRGQTESRCSTSPWKEPAS